MNFDATCNLAKYLEQEGIANLHFFQVLVQSSQVLKQPHVTKVVGYCIFQTCFSLHILYLIYLIFHSSKDHIENVPNKTIPLDMIQCIKYFTS